jgi:hypothetical protein
MEDCEQERVEHCCNAANPFMNTWCIVINIHQKANNKQLGGVKNDFHPLTVKTQTNFMKIIQ